MVPSRMAELIDEYRVSKDRLITSYPSVLCEARGSPFLQQDTMELLAQCDRVWYRDTSTPVLFDPFEPNYISAALCDESKLFNLGHLIFGPAHWNSLCAESSSSVSTRSLDPLTALYLLRGGGYIQFNNFPLVAYSY